MTWLGPQTSQVNWKYVSEPHISFIRFEKSYGLSQTALRIILAKASYAPRKRKYDFVALISRQSQLGD